jgi:hypothetical protein|tara:strand:+ start:51 stop:569 length:519 start_codon:yes stop_codon:yes gene_type:complete
MKPSYIDFSHSDYKWRADIDYRKNPGMYRIGRGQQGVLVCEPYKSEICQHWKFKTPAIARKSAEKIYSMFLDYLRQDDFVGADMAKKYLHMGFTRSRRYANHRSGRKWKNDNGNWQVLPQESDWATSEKAQSANIFRDYWKLARENEQYLQMKKTFRNNSENTLGSESFLLY